MKKKILYIDLDDTLCDFMGEFKRRHSTQLEYPHSKVGFFLNLEPLPDAIESVKKLSEVYDVRFLTRPSIWNTTCYTEKAEWIKKHFGFEMLDRLILSCDKSIFKGDYLIDDSGRDGQDKFEGEWIQFGSEKFSNWKIILEYLIK